MSIVQVAHRTACIIVLLWLTMAGVAPASTTFKSLASFDKTNGYEPNHTALIQARDGNLYGTTSYGGVNGQGAVFRVTPSGTLTAIYSFCSLAKCADGANPYTSLIQGSNGDLYGATYYGGASNSGTLFKITTSGTLTTLHSFCSKTNCADGSGPEGQLAEDSVGNIYGTANYGGASNLGTVFKFSTAGVLTTLHSFSGADGEYPEGGLVAASGVFYGTAEYGGAKGDGTVFKITTAGAETTLHSFTGSDGYSPRGWLVDVAGTLYGTTAGGAKGEGTVFAMTSADKVTTLYTFCSLASCADGAVVTAGLMQATDGNLYGVTDAGGAHGDGTAYELTLKGVLTTLHSFDGTDGDGPQGGLVQDTNGDFYGITEFGGSSNDGTVFSIATGLKPFVTLESTSGTVGSKVGILGDGFDSASVVKFNGVKAASTLTEAGLLTATVPGGATDGKVTVTTGTTTLTSTQTFVVHNTWSAGKAMPVAVHGAASGFIGGKIYVVSGDTTQGGAPVSDNQVYNTASNSWTTATAIPTPVFGSASAVVSGLLYVIGGYEGTSQTPTNLVQIYNPTNNKWTTGRAMPTARGSIAAAVDGNAIYVIGGSQSTNRLDTVEKYVPSTNTWTEEAPLLMGKSEPSAGLVGTTIVAAGGYTTSGDTGDNEGYNVSTNKWSALTADPTPRNASCYGTLAGQLYVAGGVDANPETTKTVNVNESFNPTTNKWTTQAAVPKAALWQGSAVANGQLYCFGGQASFQGAAITNVQIYQP